MGACLDSLTVSVHTRNSPHIPAHTLPPARTLHRQVTSTLTWVMYRVASTQLRATAPALTRLLTRPRVGPSAPSPAGTHTHTHTSHAFIGHTATGTRVTARQRPHHSPPGSYKHRVTKPHPCAGTRRVVLHTGSQARAHGSTQFISPLEIQVEPQSRAHRPGVASRRTQPGGRGAGTRPSQVSRSKQAPHHCGPQVPGLRNNPQQTPHDCKLSCRAAFCQPPQQTLLSFAESALHVHCPAHTHTHVRTHVHTPTPCIHGAL